MQAVHSRRDFGFVPQTFVLPADFLLFKRVFEETADSKESKWIIKPVRIQFNYILSHKLKQFPFLASKCSRSRHSGKVLNYSILNLIKKIQ